MTGRVPGSDDERRIDIAGGQLFQRRLAVKTPTALSLTIVSSLVLSIICRMKGAPATSLGTYRKSSASQRLYALPDFTSTEEP